MVGELLLQAAHVLRARCRADSRVRLGAGKAMRH